MPRQFAVMAASIARSINPSTGTAFAFPELHVDKAVLSSAVLDERSIGDTTPIARQRLIVAMPQFNVSPAAGALKEDFQGALSHARIMVFDGPSEGDLLQKILMSVDAEVAVVMNGNETYLATEVRPLFNTLVSEGATVVGGAVWRARQPSPSTGFGLGSRPIRWLLKQVFCGSHGEAFSGFFVIHLGATSS